MSQGKQTRLGFTLVEILVVIAIIGILAALTSAGVFVTISIQQRRNTSSTIRVLDKMMHNRWNEVINKAKQETPSPAVMALANNDVGRARVIWAKVRLAEAFPQNYAELSATDPKTIVNFYIPANMRKTHFNNYQTLAQGKTPGGAGESSACLLMALKTLGAEGVALDEQLRHAILNTDGLNKIDVLADGWGKPLRFTRFDTSAAVQAANPAKAGNKSFNLSDPVDPDGLLISSSWYLLPAPPLRTQFETGNALVVGFHSIALVPPPPAPTARSNYVLPVIASNGKDGIPSPPGGDDIISFELRGE